MVGVGELPGKTYRYLYKRQVVAEAEVAVGEAQETPGGPGEPGEVALLALHQHQIVFR